LYGLISQSIAQRRHELGIRLALGATTAQTIAGAMKPGILLAVAGVAVGIGGSLAAVRLLRHMLWACAKPIRPLLLLLPRCCWWWRGASLAPALRILRSIRRKRCAANKPLADARAPIGAAYS